MKIVKLDRRYAGFPIWKFAIQFPLHNHNHRKKYFDYKKAFQAMYGPDAELNPDYNLDTRHTTSRWFYNEHWRADFKRQRILVKDPALVTMIQLKLAG